MKCGRFGQRLALIACAAAMPAASFAVDGVSLEAGTGDKVQMVRGGIQWDWQKRWWQSNGTHIGGYWDATLAQWRGTRFENRDARQNITVIGITPVLRFQRDTLKGVYAEAGIGAHLMSELYDNNGDRLSTSFQFGDHVAVGYVFNNNLDLGLKLQHFSNGSIKKPNNGVNFVILRLQHRF